MKSSPTNTQRLFQQDHSVEADRQSKEPLWIALRSTNLYELWENKLASKHSETLNICPPRPKSSLPDIKLNICCSQDEVQAAWYVVYLSHFIPRISLAPAVQDRFHSSELFLFISPCSESPSPPQPGSLCSPFWNQLSCQSVFPGVHPRWVHFPSLTPSAYLYR